ncbi:MAG TPA: POTRA domain-containing protein, partial [Kofleriaceae bacterium]
MRLACIAAIVAWAAAARAQPAAKPPHDRADCVDVDTVPGDPMQAQPAPDVVVTPMPWSEFVVVGSHLLEPAATIHALLEPTLAELRTTLTVRKIPDIAKVTTKLGYQLVSMTTRPGPSGQTLLIALEPLPVVRKVDVDTHQGLLDRPLDEEIRRRMLVRIGAQLPGDPVRRRCAILEETGRIDDYLHDEGYFEAKATLHDDGAPKAAHIRVEVSLGPEYSFGGGQPKVVLPAGFTAVTADEIRKRFVHPKHTFPILDIPFGGPAPFTRTRFAEDLQHVRDLFHRREFPAARVQSNLDVKAMFDSSTKTVQATIVIDPRRRLHLEFEGVDPDAISHDDLRKHCTFDDSGSTDDIEAQTSAHALETYLQTRGYFDARVTLGPREHLAEYDQIAFHIALGRTRQVESIGFTCNGVDCDYTRTPAGGVEKRKKPFDDDALRDIVATKTVNFLGDFLGTSVAPTSDLLVDDVTRLREAYRRAGYRDAQVSVSASPSPAALGNAAVTAALVEGAASGKVGDGLAVSFTIDEGQPTRLARVEIAPDDPADAPQLSSVCDALLHELASELGSDTQPDPAASLARRTSHTACTASAPRLLFREDDIVATKDRLRDFLFKQGRPRAEIDFEAREVAPHEVEARYVVHHVRARTLGKLVIRGNFKTDVKVIRQVLALKEGQLLTSDSLADGARRLRQTGLFGAVNIDLLDLESPAEQVDAVVRIEERYDVHAQVDLEVGYSSYNSWFGTISPLLGNPFGLG